MAGFIIELVISVLVGIACIVIGIMNKMGNLSMLHSYHIDNIKEEDKLPCGKLVGTGMIIVGISLFIFGAFSIPTYFLEEEKYTVIGTSIFIVGLVVGLGITLYSIKKYNHKIM